MKRIQFACWLAISLSASCAAMAQPAKTTEKPAVANTDRVNVRAQASIFSEVVTQLHKGDPVTILEEITVESAPGDAPDRWARIRMPDNTPVWVFGNFIDPSSKRVTANRLNLRAGPGENYSVLGRIERGAVVNEIRSEHGWIEIETPASAFAFVALDLLDPAAPTLSRTPTQPAEASPEQPARESSPPPAALESIPGERSAPEISSAPPADTRQPQPLLDEAGDVIEPYPLRDETLTPPLLSTPIRALPAPLADPIPGPAIEPLAPIPAESAAAPQRRIVRREGIVRSTISIQAPTYFELISPETRKTINYLHNSDPDIRLKDFRGRTIVVTGEEGIDPRWPKIPVIEIETLHFAP
jgi:SH3-like domain-containing protein